MNPCRRLADSITSTRWLRQAERLARSIKKGTRVRRQLIDGCIVEGRRAGRNLSASVIDPPTQVMLFGFSQVPLTDDEGAPIVQLNPSCIPTNRDNLHWDWRRDPLPTTPKAERRMFAGLRAPLLARDEFEAQLMGVFNSFEHGVHEYPDGYRTYGMSVTTSNIIGGQEAPLYYRSDAYPVFYLFNLYCTWGFPNGAINQGTMVHYYTRRSNFGIAVDSEWLESYLGAQVVMDWPAAGAPYSIWSKDSIGGRWQAPWCYGSMVSIDEVPEGDKIVMRATWNVVTRICDAPQGSQDYWSRRRLALLRIQVTPNEDTKLRPSAEVQAVTIYDPSDSPDPMRHPDDAPPPAYYRINSFCAPATGPRGAMVVGQVVQKMVDGALEEYYHNVLVTTTGDFVEVETESDTPRSKCWFIGGDDVDGTVYMLNPFMDGGMVVVNAETGSARVVSRPAWRPPLDISDDGIYAEDHMRNMVTHLGDGRLAFPVAGGDGTTISMATYNVETDEIEVVGQMWSVPFAQQRGGVARIGVIQYETEERPAILLGGYHSGVNGAGATYISYDSGVTWNRFNENSGPCRAIAVVGNGIYTPTPGHLWNQEDGSDI